MPRLFHHTLSHTAQRTPNALALQYKKVQLNYHQLLTQVKQVACQLADLGLQRDQRVAIYLPKQIESVIGYYATSMAGGIFVPVNPLLKGPQISYILEDCQVSVLITSLSRYLQMQPYFERIACVKTIILTDCTADKVPANCLAFNSLVAAEIARPDFESERISQDIAAILYTSGSTGNPKGVVLSHQNLVAGAKSVAEYLDNKPTDKLLAVLPFSFDYGLSQLTTAFLSGASVVLMEYLLPRDVIKAIAQYQITGLAAVPPLWVELAELEWSQCTSLRYWTNSGGAMPQATLNRLRQKLPHARPFLMYGLTEAFRSTYLDPDEIDKRPTSIGKAIPDAEILVLNQQGQPCAAGEHGELVHRGAHVALGYWNAPEKTAQRFKPLPASIAHGIKPEIAVWSGDTVYRDEAGFLYFVGRQDDMIKSSGYRISPSEIEDCLYQHDQISEVAAIGVAHPTLGQAVVLVIKATDNATFDESALLKFCQQQLPNFMQPKALKLIASLPRNPNGKINRPILAKEYAHLFAS